MVRGQPLSVVLPYPRNAVTSISISISGRMRSQTIIVAAGRISPKVSPKIGKTRSAKLASVT